MLLNDVIVETAKRAAQSLGVDVVAASSRMSAEFVSAQDALSLVVTGADRLKAAGDDAARIIEQRRRQDEGSAKNTTSSMRCATGWSAWEGGLADQDAGLGHAR